MAFNGHMVRFTLVRVVQAAISLLAISLFVFLLVRLTGDPLDVLLPLEATPEQIQRVEESLGLNKPLWRQYVIYVGNLLQGDLGNAIQGQAPVRRMIVERIPASLQLALLSVGIGFGLAIPLGMYAAKNAGGWLDWAARSFAILGQSTPLFWLGLLLMQLLAVQLRILPAAGREGPEYIVLPALTLGIYITAGLMRLTRSSMLEVLQSDYVRMARAKGVSEFRVLWVHSLRNAAIPILTFAALLFVGILTMTVVVEVVFAWPGLGRLTIDGIRSRDFPVVQGGVLFIAGLYIVVNLCVDVMYSFLNPRIRYSSD